ncbi:hypothetical protein G9G63_06290 [Paenibacillus sp. EKM202P]|nr:hypothetical protein G9G63_06290 [Paenibacillus sp. EKM202P]KAF6572470.1 hypothetical protein G9G64_02220 [Paenibacillus sp. EKM207P]
MRFEVPVRTIYRDLDRLNIAGQTPYELLPKEISAYMQNSLGVRVRGNVVVA